MLSFYGSIELATAISAYRVPLENYSISATEDVFFVARNVIGDSFFSADKLWLSILCHLQICESERQECEVCKHNSPRKLSSSLKITAGTTFALALLT